MKKLISLFLIVSLFSVSCDALAAVKEKTVDFVHDVKKTSYTYLLLGLDDAAGNTDFIVLLNYDGGTNSYSVLGIPRDSYFSSVPAPNKINGFIPSRAADGDVEVSHVRDFSTALSASLGIRIDGTVAYTMSAVAGIVDAVGGVDVHIPHDISGTDYSGRKIEIKAGDRHLTGEEAVFFVRHRASYSLGDLGRMDAQKLFISAFINKLKSSFNPEIAIKLLTYRDKGVITDIDTSELITFALKNLIKIKDAEGSFANIPGAAVTSLGGVSYYSVNKRASRELLSFLKFTSISDFDPAGVFRGGEEALYWIYDSSDISYNVYTDEELNSLSILVK